MTIKKTPKERIIYNKVGVLADPPEKQELHPPRAIYIDILKKIDSILSEEILIKWIVPYVAKKWQKRFHARVALFAAETVFGPTWQNRFRSPTV
jgi:hypothetical protein